jgi:hypothetical protein
MRQEWATDCHVAALVLNNCTHVIFAMLPFTLEQVKDTERSSTVP